jgi:hypothetical protein
MLKMIWVVDLKAQQIFRLNEHLLVADRIRKARRNARQGNDWLRNKLLNPSSGSILVLPPLISSEGNALTKQSIGPQVQNDCDIRSKTCIPSPENPPPKNPDHGSKTLALLAIFGRSVRQPFFGRTNKTALTREKWQSQQ